MDGVSREGLHCTGRTLARGLQSFDDARSSPRAPAYQGAASAATAAASAGGASTSEEDDVTALMEEAEWQYLHQQRFNLRLRALMNRLYQQERMRRLELREGMVKVASLLAGSAALARVADPLVVTAAAGVVFVGTAAALVFAWGPRARDAARRASDWAVLEMQIEQVGARDFTEDQLTTWAARCNEIEATEAAPHPVLLDRCYRRAVDALDGEASGRPYPAWWPVLLLP